MVYKQTFRSAHRLLQIVKSDPNGAMDAHYNLQSLLLRSLIRIEKTINILRSEAAEQKRSVRIPRFGPTADQEAFEAKQLHELTVRRVKEYKTARDLLLSFGDGLAFIYINAAEVKQTSQREQSGFISGKAGLKTELAFLRKLKRVGAIAILNDLTSILNYGDITLIGNQDDEYLVLEAKAKDGYGRRRYIQEKAIEEFVLSRNRKYTELPTGELMLKEIPVNTTEQFHSLLVADLLRGAMVSKLEISEAEPGQHFLVLAGISDAGLKLIADSCDDPYVLVLQTTKPLTFGQPPVCLTISDFDCWWNLVSGRLILLCLVDQKLLGNMLTESGFEWHFEEGSAYFLQLTKGDLDEWQMAVGTHRLMRLATEFLSLRSFVEGIQESAKFINSGISCVKKT